MERAQYGDPGGTGERVWERGSEMGEGLGHVEGIREVKGRLKATSAPAPRR